MQSNLKLNMGTFLAFISVFLANSSLLSFQVFWYIVGAKPQIYGLFIVTNDFFQFAATYLFAKFPMNMHSKEPSIFLPHIFLLVIGGFVYCWIIPLGNPIIILFLTRALQGTGSSISNYAMFHPNSFSQLADPLDTTVHNYRKYLMEARYWWSPLAFGLTFIFLPYPTHNSPLLTRTFNFYTLTTWMTTIILLLLLLTLPCHNRPRGISLFNNRSYETDNHPNGNNENSVSLLWLHSLMPSSFSRDVNIALSIHLLVDFSFTFSLWALFVNLFVISVGRYHLVSSQIELWKVYIGIAVGGIVGCFLSVKRLMNPLSRYRYIIFEKIQFLSMLGGILAHIISLVIFLTNFEYLEFPFFMIPYFTATFFFGIGNVWYLRSSMVLFRRQQISAMSTTQELETKWWWTLMSTHIHFIARVSGSLISGTILFLTESQKNTHPRSVCTADIVTDSDVLRGCCFSFARFRHASCQVQNYTYFLVVLLAVLCCCGVLLVCFSNFMCLYEEEDESITQ